MTAQPLPQLTGDRRPVEGGYVDVTLHGAVVRRVWQAASGRWWATVETVNGTVLDVELDDDTVTVRPASPPGDLLHGLDETSPELDGLRHEPIPNYAALTQRVQQDGHDRARRMIADLSEEVDDTPGRSIAQALQEDQRPMVDREGEPWWLHPTETWTRLPHEDGCTLCHGLTLTHLLAEYGPFRPARDDEIEKHLDGAR